MVFGYYVPYEHLDTSYTTECKKDEDWNSIWGSGGKTAKMKAAQECYNKGYYNHTITDCGNWAFKATCSDTVPNDWSKPYSDESAKDEGFSNRNIAAKADCIKKGFIDAHPGKYKDMGDYYFSLKCIPTYDPPVYGTDSKGSKITIQKCNDWVNNDPNSCFNAKNKPDVKRWIKCDIGSSPGGIAPGDGATICDPISKGLNDFTCKTTNNCFAVTDIDVNWDPSVSGCDGAGNRLTIRKCNNWVDDDPKSCYTSKTKPTGITNWIGCAQGSSPGGIAPGDGAQVCDPITADENDFKCKGAGTCFAVTSNTVDSKCKKTFWSDPVDVVSNALPDFKWYIIIGFISILIVAIVIAVIKR